MEVMGGAVLTAVLIQDGREVTVVVEQAQTEMEEKDKMEEMEQTESMQPPLLKSQIPTL